MVTPLVRTLLERLGERYEAHRDDELAAPMRAYMRDQFAFLGIKKPLREQLDREILAGLSPLTERDVIDVVRACWKKPEREYQYFALKILRRSAKRVGTPALLDVVQTLITTKSWWDTVDELAAHAVGTLVEKHPELAATMDAWSQSEDMWLARAAILHQLRYGTRTDEKRLFAYCRARAGEKDFFFRKAIGWALRQYSTTDANTVRSFVEATPHLSPLSQREALRGVVRAEADPAGG